MVEDDWPGGEDGRHPTSLLTRMSPGSHNHLAASLAPPRLYFTGLTGRSFHEDTREGLVSGRLTLRELKA